MGKEYVKNVYCHSAYLNLHAEYIIQNAELDEVESGIKIARRNINNLRYEDDTTLMEESEEPHLTPVRMAIKKKKICEQ